MVGLHSKTDGGNQLRSAAGQWSIGSQACGSNSVEIWARAGCLCFRCGRNQDLPANELPVVEEVEKPRPVEEAPLPVDDNMPPVVQQPVLEEPVMPRRSTRVRKAPSYLEAYVKN